MRGCLRSSRLSHWMTARRTSQAATASSLVERPCFAADSLVQTLIFKHPTPFAHGAWGSCMPLLRVNAPCHLGPIGLLRRRLVTRSTMSGTRMTLRHRDGASSAREYHVDRLRGAPHKLKINDMFDALYEPSSGSSSRDRTLASYSSQDDGEVELGSDEVYSDSTETFETGGKEVVELPTTELKFKITGDHSPDTFWTSGLYRNPDDETLPIYYCKTLEAAEKRLQFFANEPLLGFDLEWKFPGTGTSIKDNVSLIQVASGNAIVLVHVALFAGDSASELLPKSLRLILESENIIKTGVNILNDANRMRAHLQVEVQGLFELSHLYRLVKHRNSEPSEVNRKLVSLDKQILEHIGMKMFKESSVRTSDWRQPLEIDQIRYAATDAFAGVVLFDIMDRKRLAMTPVPPRPEFAERRARIRLNKEDEIVYMPDVVQNRQKGVVAGETPQTGTAESVDCAEDISEASHVEDDGETAQKGDTPWSLPQRTDLRNHTARDTDINSILDRSFGSLFNSVTAKLDDISITAETPEEVSSPELERARDWVTEYLQNRSAPSSPARQGSLVAYALWHREGLTVPATARTQRAPPLKHTTVALYILDAIRTEKLPWEADRLQKVFRYAGSFATNHRFGQLRRDCGIQ